MEKVKAGVKPSAADEAGVKPVADEVGDIIGSRLAVMLPDKYVMSTTAGGEIRVNFIGEGKYRGNIYIVCTRLSAFCNCLGIFH